MPILSWISPKADTPFGDNYTIDCLTPSFSYCRSELFNAPGHIASFISASLGCIIKSILAHEDNKLPTDNKLGFGYLFPIILISAIPPNSWERHSRKSSLPFNNDNSQFGTREMVVIKVIEDIGSSLFRRISYAFNRAI